MVVIYFVILLWDLRPVAYPEIIEGGQSSTFVSGTPLNFVFTKISCLGDFVIGRQEIFRRARLSKVLADKEMMFVLSQSTFTSCFFLKLSPLETPVLRWLSEFHVSYSSWEPAAGSSLSSVSDGGSFCRHSSIHRTSAVAQCVPPLLLQFFALEWGYSYERKYLSCWSWCDTSSDNSCSLVYCGVNFPSVSGSSPYCCSKFSCC